MTPRPEDLPTAADRRYESRLSGTTTIAPRPRRARARQASARGQSPPGSVALGRADHTATGASRPGCDAAGPAPRHTLPRPAQPPREATDPLVVDSPSAFSARACRGGIREPQDVPHRAGVCRTSPRQRQHRRGQDGLGETTVRIGVSRPSCSALARRSMTYPATSRPAEPDFDADARLGVVGEVGGTAYSNGRSRCGRPESTST